MKIKQMSPAKGNHTNVVNKFFLNKFPIFTTVNTCSVMILLAAEFEPWPFGVGINYPTN